MAPKSPTDEQLQEAVDLVAMYGTAYTASLNSNIPNSTLKSRCEIARRRGIKPSQGFQLPPDQTLSGVSTLYDSKGNIASQWVKTKANQTLIHQAVKEMADEFASELPRAKIRPKKDKKVSKGDLLNLINIGDAHIGSYVWEEECGESFDISIAQADLCTAIQYLIDEGPPADTIVFAPVGDFLHADNIAGATSKGTPLDLDTRMPKVIRTGVSVLRFAIERGLDKHPNVHVVITPGNHDEILSHALTIMLDEVYSKEPRVTIHSEPTARHYMVWGKVLLGWIHGHKIKDQNIPLAVATEQSEKWGKTDYRYIYRGHHHHKSVYGVKEFNGAIVEQVRPLCPSDAYATGLGLMAGNDCMCITHHKTRGEVKRITTSLGHIREMQR